MSRIMPITRAAAVNIYNREKAVKADMTLQEFLQHAKTEVCLKTGAKLCRHPERGWFLYGYSAYGSDLLPYRKYEKGSR